MKQTKLTITLMLFAGLLLSCQPTPSLPTIMQNGAWLSSTPPTDQALIDPYVISVDVQLLDNLVASDNPFLLYLGNPTCSSCQRFKPILQQWIQETKAAVYYLNTLDLMFELPAMIAQYPTIFKESISTPSLYLIQGTTRLMAASGQTAFYQYSRFKPWIASYLIVGDQFTNHELPNVLQTRAMF